VTPAQMRRRDLRAAAQAVVGLIVFLLVVFDALVLFPVMEDLGLIPDNADHVEVEKAPPTTTTGTLANPEVAP